MPSELTLQEVMELQADFDSKHGGGASWNEEVSSDNPARLEHGVVCLVGEIGEFANVLKKVVRGDLTYESAQPMLREEITDSFIYLIKLCNQMNIDLGSEFRAKLARNWQRFASYERKEASQRSARNEGRAKSATFLGSAETALEAESDAILRMASGCRREGGRLITIVGASGSGKTTLTRALADEAQTFVETTEGNPHLARLLDGSGSFDAFENQSWFLSQVEAFLESADTSAAMVLDQDPSAIVRVYARIFRDQGQMTGAEYCALLTRLLRIEQRLEQWQTRRTILFLDLPSHTLQARVRARGDQVVPNLAWFERLRTYFSALYAQLPDILMLKTAGLGSNNFVEIARALLNDIGT